jgi:hypothetical protein
MWPPKDGTPYMPANGTEGEDFENRWCMRCANDDPETGDSCPILMAALSGEQPKEWTWQNRTGHCSAFRPFDGMEPLPEPRCTLTMEMF